MFYTCISEGGDISANSPVSPTIKVSVSHTGEL